MKVLLLHPEDRFPSDGLISGWDLVVDLGRAPLSTYEDWSRVAGCRVASLYDLAEEIGDLRRARELLQAGMGHMVDRWKIDWWDVLSVMISPDLLQLMLIRRLANELPAGGDLYSSRPGLLAAALQSLVGGRLINLERGFQPTFRRMRHYLDVFSRLDTRQLAQVLQDKFDRKHAIRRRFTRRKGASGQPVVLLPSAYVNVSRTAVSYATLLPGERFLLMCARNSGKLKSLPSNVGMASLNAYFNSVEPREATSLLGCWDALKSQLISGHEEFRIAEIAGVLGRVPRLLDWGIAIRDAWNRVFESENVTGCLSADDSNPYSRIPLILAGTRGFPTLACHHGALDSRMALRTAHADFYLAKNEMERDYLVRLCQVPSERVVMGGPATDETASAEPIGRASEGWSDKPWLVFFTEPYGTAGWRSDEIYRDLLPRLSSLARTCGLKLVFKLHPFESVKGHRRVLRRFLSDKEEREIGVIAGAASSELWCNMRFALTVQSTVALECAAREIPVFLCAWLRDPYSAYVQQFARFGVGHVLESAERIGDIPQLLEVQDQKRSPRGGLWQTIDPGKLRELLSGRYLLPTAIRA
jgi:hypothetical protein